MLCKTCKHWYQNASQMRLAGRGVCARASSTYAEREDSFMAGDPDSLAIATATPISEFSTKFVVAQLETTEGFGCNQYEAK